MKYGVGGCAQRWCRALLLSTVEPENTVFGIILWQRVVFHNIHSQFCSKLNAHTSRRGWIHQKQIFFTECSQISYGQTDISRGKAETRFLIVLQGPQTSCGGSGLDLKGLKGPWTEPAEKDRTRGHPWGEVYWLNMITCLSLSRSSAAPFVERHNFAGEECKMERDMSGWDGRERRGVKKKILLCEPDGFLKIKMSNWWKKEGCSETGFERGQEITKPRGAMRKAMSSRR